MLFVCPVCKQKFNMSVGGVVCPSGHSFDRAKEGYYNLLLGRGGLHGDNAEMVKARRKFLERGFYSPLASRVADFAKKCLLSNPSASEFHIVDAGCGEGYYTDFIADALFSIECESAPHISAFDISKTAVKSACRRRHDISFAVAGSYDMPISDSSVDLLVNIFSPLALEQTVRVLKPGGFFLMVIPMEEHLYSLKAAIYDTPYKNTPASLELPCMELISSEPLKYIMSLDSRSDIENLFMMTPYAYRTPRGGRERVLSLSSLKCEADFLILLYKKL